MLASLNNLLKIFQRKKKYFSSWVWEQEITSLHNSKPKSRLWSFFLAGAKPLLPALWLRTSLLRGQTHRHGDDEGHPGHPSLPLHGVPPARTHTGQHSADQQPVAAAGGRQGQFGHALHPPTNSSAAPALRGQRRVYGHLTFWMLQYFGDFGWCKCLAKILWGHFSTI